MNTQNLLSWRSRSYIWAITVLGALCLASANWEMRHPVRFSCYLAVCIIASALKVNLPGILGTMSVNFLFILIGILDLGAGLPGDVGDPFVNQRR